MPDITCLVAYETDAQAARATSRFSSLGAALCGSAVSVTLPDVFDYAAGNTGAAREHVEALWARVRWVLAEAADLPGFRLGTVSDDTAETVFYGDALDILRRDALAQAQWIGLANALDESRVWTALMPRALADGAGDAAAMRAALRPERRRDALIAGLGAARSLLLGALGKDRGTDARSDYLAGAWPEDDPPPTLAHALRARGYDERHDLGENGFADGLAWFEARRYLPPEWGGAA